MKNDSYSSKLLGVELGVDAMSTVTTVLYSYLPLLFWRDLLHIQGLGKRARNSSTKWRRKFRQGGLMGSSVLGYMYM